jgi:two-component system chemotaxis response regulator CheB
MAIKVYVVDDSAVVRQTLMHLLQGDPEIELMGSAPNPLIAGPVIRKNRPDVLLLDIEMPGMDGLTFLRQVMDESPIPTVICSTLTTDGSRMALEALAAGAVAVVAKPRLGLKQFLEDSRRDLLQTLKTAARSRPRAGMTAPRAAAGATAAAPRPPIAGLHALSVNKPVVIGSSTGGTHALELVLTALPGDSPGIAIVQHMPEKFTAMYAQRLDGICEMNIREAKDGDRLERGVVLIAPGGKHMQLRKAGGQYFAVVADGPPVNRHKPSVEVLFDSAARVVGRNALGVMLTGMGADGAKAMRTMREAGSWNLCQDEASCVVFGMPREAIAHSAPHEVLPLAQIAPRLVEWLRANAGVATSRV